MPPPFTSFPIPTTLLSAILFPPPNIVSAGGTFILVAGNYGDVVVTTSAAVTVQLPDSTMRSGRPVRVSDTSGSPNITILTTGGQTFLGLTTIPLLTPNGGFTLWPLATGGWYGAAG